MASRSRKLVKSLENEMVVLAGRFTPVAGTTEVTEGNGVASVEREGTGEYTLHLDEEYPALISATAELITASGTFDACVKSVDLSAKEVTIRVFQRSSDVVRDLNNDEVQYLLVLRNSSI